MTAPIDKSTADQMAEREKVNLSPADRLRARMAEQDANPIVTADLRPSWVRLTSHYEDISANSTEARTSMYCEALRDLHDSGEYVPGELLIMARAYLQPRTYDQARSRTHDPATSKAAEPHPLSARSQSHRLLQAYRTRLKMNDENEAPDRARINRHVPIGLTAPEAALLIQKPGAYRRVPELHHAGLLKVLTVVDPDEPTGPPLEMTRPTIHGAQARVFVLTDAGVEEVRRLNKAAAVLDRRDSEREERKRARGNRRA